jgi:YHS domain-containing protein
LETETTVQRLTDPVCGMSVRLDAAEHDGLILEHHGTLYAFCRAACREAFEGDPHRYAQKAPIASASPAELGAGLPAIDEGMRRWYDSCSCCLSDTYPEVKAALDEERAAQAQTPAGPGICEVAEGAASSTGS